MKIKYNEVVQAKTMTDAWDRWWDVLTSDITDSSTESRDGLVVAEVINATTVITDATRGICLSKVRNMSMRYAVGELMWYLSGNSKESAIHPYTTAWDRLRNEDGTVNSNYGNRIQHHYHYDQWEYAVNTLWHNPNSRQVVIHIKDGHQQNSTLGSDVPCTVALQYTIRDGALHCTVFMRSNDLWMGMPYDVFSFTALQVKMAMELSVGIGSYTHHATSLHLYERDYRKWKERYPIDEAGSQAATPENKPTS